jgi:hypothetical protein
MERIPYNNRGRGRGSMDARYDRSQPRDNERGRPHFSMPQDSYARPPMQGQHQSPIPHQGYGHPPPRPDNGEFMNGPRSDFNPRPAIIDAGGPSTDTAKHAK